MSQTGNLKKYLLITKLLRDSSRNYLPLKTIQTHLQNHGLTNVSDRTLQRDFIALREEFGMPVKYHPQQKGWHLDFTGDEDLDDYQQFIKLLELADRVNTISRTFQDTGHASRFIVFEEQPSFKGSEHLSRLTDAISRKVVVSYQYQPFAKDHPREYRTEPYLIIEYRNRWYLLGWDIGAGKLKTFGLDRMSGITLTDELCRTAQPVNYKALFRHTYGITCLPESPQRIVLSFTPQQGKYLKTLPLHASQEILVDTETEFRIALCLVLNYELKKEILSYGAAVQVLEPESLRNEIMDALQKALKNYAPRQVLA